MLSRLVIAQTNGLSLSLTDGKLVITFSSLCDELDFTLGRNYRRQPDPIAAHLERQGALHSALAALV